MKHAALLLLLPGLVLAEPRVISDPTDMDPPPIQCAFYINGATTSKLLDVAMDADTGLPYCLMPIGNLAPGSYKMTAAFVVDFDLWGTVEGPQSLPLEFSKPGALDVEIPTLRLNVPAAP